MLRTLHIRDFVIVDQAEIHFDNGFTVFSGETGAGKSILIDALSLALGSRGDAGVLREGAKKTDITAMFDPPTILRDWLQEHELDPDDALVLRRVIDNQGRSRSFINGLPVALGQLRELGEYLVDIHGQHAHQSLLKPASQRDLLDSQGGHQDLARQVHLAWTQWQSLEKNLLNAQQQAAHRQAESQRLNEQLSVLKDLGLQEGEWETISNDHNRLANMQALLQGTTLALAALDAEEASALQALNLATQQIKPLLRHDPQLQGVYDAIESAHIASTEAISDLNNYLSRLDLDPERLAQADRRLSAIFDIARKFKVEPHDLLQLQASLHQQLDANQAAGDTEALAAQAQQAQQQYQTLSTQLTQARIATSQRLAEQVTQAMQTLAMQGGRFDITLQPCAASPHGVETVEFLVAGHAGVRPRPLAKVASGGELARLSLALSVIASQAARVPTLLFDEVDTGVGGAVAEVVGRLLSELGLRHQVLCVTHLPQVAARGNHHYQVSKSTTGDTTLSAIAVLNKPERITEIARMLGGLKITDTTRKHAAEMLQSA